MWFFLIQYWFPTRFLSDLRWLACMNVQLDVFKAYQNQSIICIYQVTSDRLTYALVNDVTWQVNIHSWGQKEIHIYGKIRGQTGFCVICIKCAERKKVYRFVNILSWTHILFIYHFKMKSFSYILILCMFVLTSVWLSAYLGWFYWSMSWLTNGK